jgi:hypothetical protein
VESIGAITDRILVVSADADAGRPEKSAAALAACSFGNSPQGPCVALPMATPPPAAMIAACIGHKETSASVMSCTEAS